MTQLLPYCEELLPVLLKKKDIFFVEEAVEQGSIAQMTGNLLLQNGYQGNFFVRADAKSIFGTKPLSMKYLRN